MAQVRLFKVARELNLGTDTIVAHLRKKGFDIENNPNAKLTDEMYVEILTHFRKDKEAFERHRRKEQLFREREEQRKRLRHEVVTVDSEVGEVVVAEPPAAPEPSVGAPAELEPPTEPVEVLEAALEEPQEAPPVVSEEVASEPAGEVPSPSQEPEPLAEPVSASEEPHESVLSPPSGEVIRAKDRVRLPGLTVVGKIEYDKGKLKPEAAPGEKPEQKVEEEPEKKKKKKRKRIAAPMSVEEEELPLVKKGAILAREPVAKKKKKKKAPVVDEEEVARMLRETMAEMERSAGGRRGKLRRAKREERAAQRELERQQAELEAGLLRVSEFVTARELAELMHVDVGEVLTRCLALGLPVSINQRLDADTITLLADEFGYQVQFVDTTELLEVSEEAPDKPEDLRTRPPIVTVMGHVDHGKTSLLDYIRHTNVVAGEAGGITQHIGAYEVTLPDGRQITFLDTPGHEAFTAMRARGTQVTDIVVLVVAADDQVMPQTVEAINHAKAAGVPIVVAINKIDKPEANPDRIRQQLAEHGVLVEEWGGRYQCAEISAKTGQNVDALLEKILLEAELLELKANPNRKAQGTVIEAKLDKGRGVVATVLVQNGTLRPGDPFVAGLTHGKVRALFNERDQRVEAAGPSTPVQVLGFEDLPQAGDRFLVVSDEREAREIALKRQQIKREQDLRRRKHLSLEDVSRQMAAGQLQELNIILKGDVAGSVEALGDALHKLSRDEVRVHIIHSGVGAITESDVLLASASNAVIIGFQVRPSAAARKLAEQEQIDIRLYSIIYDAINDVKSALEGLLAPERKEQIVGTAEVRATFKVPKVGTVAGCYVSEGRIRRSDRIRLIRDGVVIYEGRLASLKRFKDDVREVGAGYECGMGIEGYNDIKVGDLIEAYEIVETKRTLDA
ncbi:MAG: translation initiation factor IF-2 [Bacteroidota bacterium]|nr:translation initiation factor IF-2 [Rhodothermia bacterium]MCS7154825.1 translation initiation factor IF-2 [Bacteroidota bacterium]MDW8137619.1 translation initiation factor IF-2 [Bacteroidota bacterium]MDW8285427.1 translation initiation factor IF-2 [Bacteroidota bacterium]